MSLDGILKYAMKRTHYKAQQVIGTHGFTENDFLGLRQELLTDIQERLPKFNGDRASVKTFICRLIDNRIASIIKHRSAACRDHRREECSLDDWTRDEFGAWETRGALMDEDRVRAHAGLRPRSRQEQLELALDTAQVGNSLPENIRDLFMRLKSQTVSEIARDTGVSRTRLYEQIDLIRAKCSDAGLDQYL
jgi:RNA polymerase sigma factor (sigma-70 family)